MISVQTLVRSATMATLGAVVAVALGQSTAATPWKVLVMVYSRGVVLSENPTRVDRFYLNELEIAHLMASLESFERAAERESGGKLDVQFEFKTDDTPIYRLAKGGWSMGDDPVRAATRVQFNEAPFESDDKTPRGPYSGVFVIDPVFGAWQPGGQLATQYGVLERRFATPVAYLSMLPTDGAEGPDALARDFLNAWRAQVGMRTGRPAPLPTDPSFWQSIPAAGAPVRNALLPSAFFGAFAQALPPVLGIFDQPESVTTEKGPGVKVRVNSGVREGVVPVFFEGERDLSTVGAVEFWVSSTVPDALELRMGDSGVRIELNPAKPIDAKLFPPSRFQARFLSDGTWQRVLVPIEATGRAGRIELGIPLASKNAEWNQLGTREIQLAGLRFIPKSEASAMASAPDSEATSASIDSLKKEEQVAALYNLAFDSKTPSVELLKRLKELARSSEPVVSLIAIRALSRIDSPEVQPAIDYALEVGPFEHCRLAAGMVIAEQSAPTRVNRLATLLTARDWLTRLVAVQGVAKVPNRETTIIQLAFLRDPQPQVRLAVVRNVPLDIELSLRRMLFAAVNDPVEEIRIVAYRRLIEQSTGDIRTEALKGVRDESPYVRVSVLEAMATKPASDYRRSIQLGLADRDARVRLAAIRALGAQQQKPTREELAAVLEDADAEVRSAAQALLEGLGKAP